MARHFYYVVPDRSQGRLYAGGSLLARHASLQSAIAAGVSLASAQSRDGEEAEVLVQEEDGRYRVEWTPEGCRAGAGGA
jgi:hypothetical protein